MDNKTLGICSSPTVEGDRVYVVTNRCELLCLDTEGMGNGNDGPFKDEASYLAQPAEQKLNPKIVMKKKHRAHVKPGTRPIFVVTPAEKPVELSKTDADIIWRYDMMNELAVWPQDVSNCSVLIHGNLLYAGTSNGVDRSHGNIPSPHAPSLIVLDKRMGKLVAVDDAGIGPRILHGSWSSPSLGKVGGRTLVFFGGADGVCYAFDAVPRRDPKGGPGMLKKVWWYDCNPPSARFKDRRAARYPKPKGPSEIIATPVFYRNRVYVDVGQDPRHGKAPGLLSCIDATGTGDITDKGRVWEYNKINRSFSTVSIADGLLYVGDIAGTVHCLDAETGGRCWTYETKGEIWGSAFTVDGKVFIGNKHKRLWIFAAGRNLKLLSKTYLRSPMLSTPIVANGVLYVCTNKYLFAVRREGPSGLSQMKGMAQ